MTQDWAIRPTWATAPEWEAAIREVRDLLGEPDPDAQRIELLARTKRLLSLVVETPPMRALPAFDGPIPPPPPLDVVHD